MKTKAVCNKTHTDEAIIRQVRENIARLKELKEELELLIVSDSGKINDQITEMESIFLMDMRPKPKESSFVQPKSIQVLKIRPFFDGFGKKYQIGEMDGKYIDAQSR